MKIIDIQRKLNINYNEARLFKERAELLGLFSVSGSYMLRVTQLEAEAISRAGDTLSSMVGCGTEFDDEALKIVKHIDKLMKRNGFKRDFK